ncbi:MAG: dicarboxylate--CoA ligase PimA [Rhodospirillaceae bacterium]|nr:dicarboxylate--CoA ligase PimA [Rhodospirillaceae bacterium]|tara:strand:+ start:52487 stop:54151 length:1665 start_codon:yes stop_codon:yes gene_type:complete
MLWEKKYPEDVDWNSEIKGEPLFSILDNTVKNFGNRKCIDFLGKEFSYKKISQMVDRAALGFQQLGVTKGTKVGLFLPNCPQFVVSYFGILKAGGVVVNFSPLYAENEIIHQLEDSDTDIMVTLNLKILYPKIFNLLNKTRLKKIIVGTFAEVIPFPKNILFPLVKMREISNFDSTEDIVPFAELINNDGDYKNISIDPDEDIAVLQYTGGTTGVSKGAMLTHSNLYANLIQERLWFPGFSMGEESVMAVLPFFHVFAMTVVMNMSIQMGAKMIMHPRFELLPVLKDIHSKKATFLAGVPTMYNAILNYPKISKFDLSSIKACLSGGAPLPLDVKKGFENITGCTLVEGYGLTETSPVACANPINGENKENSVGLPMPKTLIHISDKENPKKILKQGEIGEICISGPQVMKGYWKKPGVTNETIIDGRFRTGDVGYLDEDGYTFIIDRIKDLVLVNGFNVYPRNVEEGIYKHPSIAEVTVIGIPDSSSGEAVKAFIKLKDGENLEVRDLLNFLKDKLSKIEIPKFLEFRDELPKTMIGKLSKKELVAEEIEKNK